MTKINKPSLRMPNNVYQVRVSYQEQNISKRSQNATMDYAQGTEQKRTTRYSKDKTQNTKSYNKHMAHHPQNMSQKCYKIRLLSPDLHFRRLLVGIHGFYLKMQTSKHQNKKGKMQTKGITIPRTCHEIDTFSPAYSAVITTVRYWSTCKSTSVFGVDRKLHHRGTTLEHMLICKL